MGYAPHVDCLLKAWLVAELCLGSVMTLLNPPNAVQIFLASWDVHALGVEIVCYGLVGSVFHASDRHFKNELWRSGRVLVGFYSMSM